MFLFKVVGGEDLRKFLEANSTTSNSGRDPQEAFTQMMTSQSSAPQMTREDLEVFWLRSKSATGGTVQDMWGTYLAGKGFAAGSLRDRIINWLNGGTP